MKLTKEYIKLNNKIRKLIIKQKELGISYKFFIQKTNSDITNFSLFIHGKKNLNKKRTEILKEYFAL